MDMFTMLLYWWVLPALISALLFLAIAQIKEKQWTESDLTIFLVSSLVYPLFIIIFARWMWVRRLHIWWWLVRDRKLIKQKAKIEVHNTTGISELWLCKQNKNGKYEPLTNMAPIAVPLEWQDEL